MPVRTVWRGRAATLAAVLLAALVLGAAASPAAPPPQRLEIEYQVYVGGLNLVEATVIVGIGPSDYGAKVNARAESLLNLFTHWSFVASAGGAVSEAGMRPQTYDSTRQLHSKHWDMHLRYDPAGAVTVSAEPPMADDRLQEIPQSLRTGSLDPLSAIVALVWAQRGEAGCSGAAAVFDGRRRYDVIVHPGGSDELKPTSYSIFAGVAQRCEVVLKPIAGFKLDPERHDFWSTRGADDPGRPASVWLAALPASELLLPVRLEAHLPVGEVIAHIAAVRVLPAAPTDAAPGDPH